MGTCPGRSKSTQKCRDWKWSRSKPHTENPARLPIYHVEWTGIRALPVKREAMEDLSAAERRSQIAQMVLENGKVLVGSLVEQFQVTETSIRRDLTLLEANNRLKRIHGGAIPIPGSSRTDSFDEEKELHIKD